MDQFAKDLKFFLRRVSRQGRQAQAFELVRFRVSVVDQFFEESASIEADGSFGQFAVHQQQGLCDAAFERHRFVVFFGFECPHELL